MKRSLNLVGLLLASLIAPVHALAITFSHPAQETAYEQMKLTPELVKALKLPLPADCQPLLVVQGSLKTKTSRDAVLICATGHDPHGDPLFALLVFFSDSTGYRQVARSDTLIDYNWSNPGEASGQTAFNGVPSINHRVLTLTYEESGTGCMGTDQYKWRYESGGLFHLIGYYGDQNCGEFGENRELVDTQQRSIDINLKTGVKIQNGKIKCRVVPPNPPITLEVFNIERDDRLDTTSDCK